MNEQIREAELKLLHSLRDRYLINQTGRNNNLYDLIMQEIVAREDND